MAMAGGGQHKPAGKKGKSNGHPSTRQSFQSSSRARAANAASTTKLGYLAALAGGSTTQLFFSLSFACREK